MKNIFLSVALFGAMLFSPIMAWSKDTAKIVYCNEYEPKTVRIGLGRLTVLSFAVAPKDILPGETVFDFKQIKNDLAIKSLRPNAKTNIFVYMRERRCAFNLVTVRGTGDDILFVRDPKDRQIEVKFNE